MWGGKRANSGRKVTSDYKSAENDYRDACRDYVSVFGVPFKPQLPAAGPGGVSSPNSENGKCPHGKTIADSSRYYARTNSCRGCRRQLWMVNTAVMRDRILRAGDNVKK